MRVFIEPIIQKCHPVCNANEKFLNRIRRTITVASRAFVRTKAKFARRIKILLCSFACWDAIPIPVIITVPWWLRIPAVCWKSVLQKTRSLHPSDVVQGFGISQQAFCNAKMVFVYTKTLLARVLWSLSTCFPNFKIILQIRPSVFQVQLEADGYFSS